MAPVPRGANVVDGIGHGTRREHRLKAPQRNVCRDEKYSRGKGDAGRGFEMMALPAQYPGHHGTKQKPGGGQPRGQAQRGKGWSSEIE